MNEIKSILEKFSGYFSAAQLQSPLFGSLLLHTAPQQHVACVGKRRSKSGTMIYLSKESHVSFNSMYELKGLWENHE